MYKDLLCKILAIHSFGSGFRHTANPAPPYQRRHHRQCPLDHSAWRRYDRGPLSCAHRRSRMRSPQFICFRWESTHQGPMSHSMRGVHPWEHLCTNVRVQRYLLLYEATLFVEEGTLIANFLTYCCPGAEPAHVANRSRVVGQFSSLTRLLSALV